MMIKDSFFITATALLIALMGCGRSNPVSDSLSDEESVRLLISSSNYADCSDYADDGLAEFPLSNAKADSFPEDVIFLRRIESRWSRVVVSLDSGRTTAWAEVRVGSKGRLVVDNHRNGVCDTCCLPVEDQGRRQLAFRKYGGQWRVYGASPLELTTASTMAPVDIDSIAIQGSAGLRSRAIFRHGDQTRVWAREEMPTFIPGAIVTVTVWGKTDAAGDSCWAFLHRRVLQSGLPAHLRLPMVRQASGAFSRSWIVEPTEGPVVQHASIALLLGSSLFGDGSSGYSANIWTIPYVITSSDSLPK